MVAKHGDACNLGSIPPEEVRNKLQILRKHCEDVGRDYDSVLKTKNNSIILAEDAGALKDKIARFKPDVVSKEEWLRRKIAGTPEEVGEVMKVFVRDGIRYLNVSFPDAETLDGIRLFAREVIPMVKEMQL